MAWTRKLLRVNLTERTCTSEPLNMEWAKQYLGQRGLASKYLCEEVDPKVDPLGPDNKLIFATGPLTGTCAPTGGRYSVITKGPLTGAIACSNSGGYFGAELKMAGWDMIIFEGKAPKPVYLHLEDDRAELCDADGFVWGKSVWETEELLRAKHQDPQLKMASIGVAGEKGVLFSAVVNDLHRAAGRSGVGAVMGAKNLKAVAVRGTVGVTVDDPSRFMEATGAAKHKLAENEITGQGLPALGTNVLMNVINEAGALPTRNAQAPQFDGARRISAEAMAEKRPTDGKANLVTNQACFGCTIACGRVSRMDQTHFAVESNPKYWEPSGGLEYESAWALGAATEVDDLEALTYCNYLCNEQGMDPISYGSTVGAAMELYETGALSDADTGGIELKFGSAEALVKVTELTAVGEGFGQQLGLGSKRLCEKYGKPELSMSVKGQEFPAYDPRGVQSMGLTYATSNRGACHLRSYTIAAEMFGIPQKTDPLSTEGKAELVKAFQDLAAAVDSSGLCLFTTFALTPEDIAPQLDAACEGTWSPETLAVVGERVWNLERQFNLGAGFSAEDDTLPKRLLGTPLEIGPAKGKVAGLKEMLPQYYRIRGWTPEGVPTKETLDRLGL